VKINVQDVAFQGVMLDFLNEREAAGDLRTVRNGQIDQHVFAHGVRQQVRDFALIQRKVHGFVVSPVNHGRDPALLFDFVDRGTTHVGAGLCC
jgi:hypothetical protein